MQLDQFFMNLSSMLYLCIHCSCPNITVCHALLDCKQGLVNCEWLD